MDKLLIVDDEEIERESMAEFIDWTHYNIELAGTAWNGVEALDIIQRKKPDIVLTDIKMPGMNGIELIRKTKALFPEIEFVVLSGYGDYEYTSQAMEEGVRHYVLKPCDEEKIAAAIMKAQAELKQKRDARRQKLEYEQTIDRLLPRAAEQVFRNLILGREQPDRSYPLFVEQLGGEERKVRLVIFRREKGFDYLEQYAVQNMLGDLLPAGTFLLGAVLKKDLLILLAPCADSSLDWMAERVRQEFRRFAPDTLACAVSREANLSQIRRIYEENQLLFSFSSADKSRVLMSGKASLVPDGAAAAFDVLALQQAADYESLLFELSLAFLKLQVLSADISTMRNVCAWVLLAFDADTLSEKVRTAPSETALMQAMAIELSTLFHLPAVQDKIFGQILEYCFFHIGAAELSLSFLAKDIFYQSERNLGRLFSRCANRHFSAWLEDVRMRLAMRLLKFDSSLKVRLLAELLGYMPDGQYFAKAFRKQIGISPSEYREQSLKKTDTQIVKNDTGHVLSAL